MEAQILLAMMGSRYPLTHATTAKIVPLRQVTTYPKDGMPMIVNARYQGLA
jgi:cytochrome P450